MAKIHTLTYNGTKSSDLGVFVTGSGSFDAAEFDVDKYEIPGRNGDLILSNDRYKNIEITYPAFIPKAFMDKVQNVRNWLRSSRVYARLEDTYDTDHYRLGIPTGVQSFSPENRNDGANFEMTFDCKPQRFLKVGETPETVEADVQTETGEIVTFETVAESPITSASVSLSPIQSLNGYDSPWPGGGGANKIAWNDGIDFTLKGVRYYVSGGKLYLDGTSSGETSSTDATFEANFKFKLPAGTYYFTRGDYPNATYLQHKVNGASAAIITNSGKFTLAAEDEVWVGFYVYNKTFSNLHAPIQIVQGATAPTTYAPYSNICPISGHTGAELIRTGKNLLPHKFYQFGSTQLNVGTDTSTTYAHYLKAGTYTLSASLMGQARWLIREEHDTANTNVGGTLISANPHGTFTIDKDGMYRIWLYGSGITEEMVLWFQLELGSSATTYEPYSGDTYSVTFPETIYGGSHEFVSGKAAATMAKYTITGANIAAYNKEGNLWRITITGINYGTNNNYKNGLCDRYTVQTSYGGVNSNNNSICFNSSDSTQILIRDDTFTTTNIRNLLNANPLEVVYPLATPLEYTLSPQQLTTLQGQNVVWSDAGEITLTYAEPYNIENPTLFDARPLFTVTNPAEGDVIMVNSQAITFVDGYTGTVFIDCETMNAFSGAANLNSIIQATDFPVLVPGTNIVTWTGAGECTMTPRWWEL